MKLHQATCLLPWVFAKLLQCNILARIRINYADDSQNDASTKRFQRMQQKRQSKQLLSGLLIIMIIIISVIIIIIQ